MMSVNPESGHFVGVGSYTTFSTVCSINTNKFENLIKCRNCVQVSDTNYISSRDWRLKVT